MRVLCVEDDPISLRILAAAVRKLGHECEVAPDGEQAWAMFQARQPDVVISDWSMPVVDGLELCRRVRSKDSGTYAYFVFMTVHEDKSSFLAGMRAGADDYLVKPIDLEGLEARLIAASRVMALHHRLVEAARTDALTGVGNRLRLRDDLRAVYANVERYQQRCAGALCDVDNFKRFNDTHGHVAGDEALVSVAQTIASELRAGDTVYRYGGEELLVLFSGQSIEGARIPAERLRAAVEAKTRVTVSIGLAEIRASDAPRLDLWIARADEALYRAKAGGRNRVCVADADG
jgi:diguanylate cyclase (GGDEF)-like protein